VIITQHSNFNRAPAEEVDGNCCRILLVNDNTQEVTELFRDEKFSESDWIKRMGKQKSWLETVKNGG